MTEQKQDLGGDETSPVAEEFINAIARRDTLIAALQAYSRECALEAVRLQVNIFRATVALRTSHCIRHEWSAENTYTRTDGSRFCRVCARDKQRERWHARV